jgi:hypothetical protein
VNIASPLRFGAGLAGVWSFPTRVAAELREPKDWRRGREKNTTSGPGTNTSDSRAVSQPSRAIVYQDAVPCNQLHDLEGPFSKQETKSRAKSNTRRVRISDGVRAAEVRIPLWDSNCPWVTGLWIALGRSAFPVL